MELDETRAFVRVARAGSFTAAARLLGVPKSTLSRQLTRLEERLGTRLLHRTTRKLAMTEAGADFYARCAPAIEALEQAERDLLDRGTAPRGTLRVAAPFDFARDWLSPLLADFHARYPQVELRVDVSPRRVDLIEEGYDVAIRGGYLDDSSLVSRKLASSALIFCASPDYLCGRSRPEGLDDLRGHPLASFASPPGGFPIDGPQGRERLEATAWLVINEWGSLRRIALSCAGIVLVEVHSVAEDLAAGRLERVLPRHAALGGGLYAVFPSGRHMSAKLRAFIDFLAERLPLTRPGDAAGLGA
ncbi:MAG: LysR substrate-binding domain-containing protein [Myxococcales bacterium]|jgi:DNA-binding transcriptional LysR family regulator